MTKMMGDAFGPGSSPKTVEPQEGLDASHSIPIAEEPDDPYGPGHTHEAMHATWMLMESVGAFLIDTRSAEEFPEVKMAFEAAHSALFGAYQLLGQRWAAEDDIAAERGQMARAIAQGIEARQGGDASCGSVVDESPTPRSGDAPKGDEARALYKEAVRLLLREQSLFMAEHKRADTASRQLAEARAALQWYGEKAESLARYMAGNDRSQWKLGAVEAVLTELSLDAGQRKARALLSGETTP